MNRLNYIITSIILLLIINTGLSQPRERPSQWGTEIIGTELDNFYKIDEGVYRSKQPNPHIS